MKNEAPKLVEKSLLKIEKSALKTSQNLSEKLVKNPIYSPEKASRWALKTGQIGLSVDCPVDRPTVKFLTVGLLEL